MAVVFVAPSARAQETQIDFLTPFLYAEPRIPELSDEEGRPVHLVAWVSPAPASPAVEFELHPLGSSDGTGGTVIAAKSVGSDTWEAEFAIPPTFEEGDYQLTARAFSGSEEVANSVMSVRIDHAISPPEQEIVDIIRPENVGPLGFYLPPGKPANTAIWVQASSGTEQVRVFYTTSLAGTPPVWIACGAAAPNPDSQIANARCTLQENASPLEVTAIAAVANNTPITAAPTNGADDASDASRVLPYMQVPTKVAFEQDGYTVKEDGCRDFTLFVSDQNGDPIAAANIDLHAQGPSDELKFATNDFVQGSTTNNPYQQPDKGHQISEPAYGCGDATDAAENEADHNLSEGSDVKHIESTDGTDDDGSFTFTLFSPTQGESIVTAWVEGDDDDSRGISEVTGFARIGREFCLLRLPQTWLSMRMQRTRPRANACE